MAVHELVRERHDSLADRVIPFAGWYTDTLILLFGACDAEFKFRFQNSMMVKMYTERFDHSYPRSSAFIRGLVSFRRGNYRENLIF